MKLYKYYSSKIHDKILMSDGDISLRFSQPSLLNDPFDLSPSIEIPDRKRSNLALATKVKTSKNPDYFIDAKTGEHFEKGDTENTIKSLIDFEMKRKSQLLKEHNDQCIGVLSLSRKFNNSLMWSHYSDSHKGFMIEIENNFKFPNGEYKKAEEVSYDPTRPVTKLSESHSDKQYFLYKDPIWHYEEESRLVIDLELLPLKNSIADTGLPCHCLVYPRCQVSKIVIGALCPKHVEDSIIEWATKKGPIISVEKVYLSSSSYELEYKKP